jgi:alpha-glucuronidase
MLSTTPLRLLLVAVLLLVGATGAAAEDGYDLWLRYRPLESAVRVRDAPHATAIVVRGSSATLAAAANELQRGLSGLLAHPVGQSSLREGAIVLDPHCGIGGDGFRIRSTRVGGHHVTLIAAHSDIGVLYGAFAFLRLVETGRSIANLDVRESPKLALRMLDHWDNLDGTVERGYAGRSLWNWAELPRVSPRMIDYARANASIGINAVVLNNVNADARILTAPYLQKVAALADSWRPYGIRILI